MKKEEEEEEEKKAALKNKKQPLSLEEMLARRAAEKEAESKVGQY